MGFQIQGQYNVPEFRLLKNESAKSLIYSMRPISQNNDKNLLRKQLYHFPSREKNIDP